MGQISRLVDHAGGPLLFALTGDEASAPAELEPHAHARGQLLATTEGILTVATDRARFLLPPHRALWIPPRERHAAAVRGPARCWTVYVAPRACAGLPSAAVVVHVTGLLREAVERAASWTPKDRALAADEARVAAVIVDEIARAPHEKLQLPMPTSPALARLARHLVEDPGDARTIDELAPTVAMAKRTFTRHFRAETGISFASWRAQLRMHVAVERLAAGESVTRIALALGYESPSAFTAAFRRVLGAPPTRFQPS